MAETSTGIGSRKKRNRKPEEDPELENLSVMEANAIAEQQSLLTGQLDLARERYEKKRGGPSLTLNDQQLLVDEWHHYEFTPPSY
jgi:hypothetical protein